MPERIVEVTLHDLVVGHLVEQADGFITFRIDPGYRAMPRRPVLGQWFEDDLQRRQRGRTAGDLPPFFANLVPEGHLRELIESSLQVEPADELGLLAAVGTDLPGAVGIREVDQPPILETYTPEQRLDVDVERATDEAQGLRFSLAGVQLKFSVVRDANKLTLPARNQHGHWIVKVDSDAYPNLVENEFVALEWARRAGFDVPECHLHEAEDLDGLPKRLARPGSRVLAVRRFDRTVESRIHQEDFAQVVNLPPKLKYEHVRYEQLATLVARIVGADGYDEVIRRLVLVVATGNNDAHLKNWSLLYPDGIQARLAPLYDQVATVAWPNLEPTLALKLAGTKNFAAIDEDRFAVLATRAGADPDGTVAIVRETVTRLAGAWREIEGSAPLPEEHARAIREHWRTVPVLRGEALLL